MKQLNPTLRTKSCEQRMRLFQHTHTFSKQLLPQLLLGAMLFATTHATAVAQFGGIADRMSSAMQRSMPRPPFGPPPMSPMSPMRSGPIGPGSMLGSGPMMSPFGGLQGSRRSATTTQHHTVMPTPTSLGQEVGQAVVGAAMDSLASQGVLPGTTYPHYTQPAPVHAHPSAPVTVYQPLSPSPTIVATTRVSPSDTVFAGPAPVQSQEERAAMIVRESVSKAKEQFRQGSYEACAASIERALAISPEDSDLLQFRAFAYFASGDIDSAAADIYDALQTGNTWNWQAAYDLYQSRDKYELHLRRLEQKCTVEPSMSTHFALGYQYIVLEHLARGQKELNKALVFQPEEPLITQLVAVIDQVVASK